MALHKVRAVALSGYEDVARVAGLDPAMMLARHGISPLSLVDPEERIPATSAARLLEDSARESGIESFGLMMAEQRSFESLGPVTELYRPLGSLRELVEATMRGRRLLNDIISFQIADGAEDCFIEIRFLPQFASPQAIILSAALMHRNLDIASRGRWKPSSVHFRHSLPIDAGSFESFFAVPVHFGRPSDGFVCDRSMLEARWQPESELESAFKLIGSLERKIAALKEMSGTAQPDLIRSLEDALADIRSATEELRG